MTNQKTPYLLNILNIFTKPIKKLMTRKQRKFTKYLRNHPWPGYYQSTEFIKTRLEMAPNADTARVYTNYLKILADEEPTFFPVHRSVKNADAPLRISVITDFFDIRVYRMSLMAKTFGAKLQLLWHGDARWYYQSDFPKDVFESIIEVQNPFVDMKAINKHLLRFNTDIVHCHAQCTQTPNVLPLVFAAKTPVIVDYYDLNHASYVFWRDNLEPWFKPCLFFEKYAFIYADGRCMRHAYLGFPEVKAINRIKAPTAVIGEPIISDWIARKQVDPHKKLQIILDGRQSVDISPGKESPILPYQDKAIEYLHTHCDIDIFIVRGTHLKDRYKDYNVTILDRLPSAEYHNFLKDIDAQLVICPLELVEVLGMNVEHIKYGTGGDPIAMIENDIICIYPEEWQFRVYQLTRSSRGIPYALDDLLDVEFWKNLPDRIRQLQAKPLTCDTFTEKHLAPRLERLYRRTIAHACAKRGEKRI